MLCNRNIFESISLSQYLFTNNYLCFNCDDNLKYQPIKFKIENFTIQSLFLYDEGFKKLLLQYKEAYDEALALVLVEKLKFLLKFKYFNYTIVWVPSSNENIKRRGFQHLEIILKKLNLKYLDLFYKDGDFNQNNLNSLERTAISKHIFIKNIPIPKKVLLIDDIITTGSSIISCAKLLSKYPVKLKILTLSYNISWFNKINNVIIKNKGDHKYGG